MKYTWQIKAQRNKDLIGFKNQHPEYSLAKIAQVYGITRQRVFAILKHHDGRRDGDAR